MSYLIVSDSSSNILKMQGINYKTVPLHIMLGDTDWPDTEEVDLEKFDVELGSFRGKTSSSCPSPHDWLEAFGDEETVFCVTISVGLSGSYNSAVSAKHIYEEMHPDRKVYVLDSLATGPKMVLMMEYLIQQIRQGADYETAYEKTLEYREKVGLLFTLESINMLANAGRVSPLIAKAVGILNVRMIGTASSEGTIIIVDKYRGYQKQLAGTFREMLKGGYNGGHVIISHTRNQKFADELTALIKEKFADAKVDSHWNTVLCSYYAEKNGMIIGFEKAVR